MEDNSRHYSEREIIEFACAIRGDEKPIQWLMDNDCKELAALHDVIIFNNDLALKWLKENKYLNLVAFLSALNQDDDGLNYLLKSPYKEWAATASAFNEDDEAKEILLKAGLKHYFLLSEILFEKESVSSGSIGLSGGSGGSGGSSGGGGFGGFGGGSFGGGGASGAW